MTSKRNLTSALLLSMMAACGGGGSSGSGNHSDDGSSSASAGTGDGIGTGLASTGYGTSNTPTGAPPPPTSPPATGPSPAPQPVSSPTPAPSPAPAPGPAAVPSFYVAPTGSDTSDGSSGHPFATLNAAQAAVRASSTIKTVQLATGTYYLSAPLAFGAADSGETWTAAPNATPVISGGVPITGWTSAGNGVYIAKASAPVGLDLEIAGSRQQPADLGYDRKRPFITGWRLVDSSRALPSGGKTFNVFAGDLSSSVKPGAILQILDSARYSDEFGTVASVDAVNNTVTLSGTPSPPSAGSWRILADPADLTSTGQFSYNSATMTVAIKPVSACAISSNTVAVAAQLNTLFSISGTSSMPIQGLTIQGLTFSDTNTPRVGYTAYSGIAYNSLPVAAITGTGLANSKINGNHFVNVGNAISLSSSLNDDISSNVFDQLAASGISVKGQSDNVNITHNVMTSLGQINAGSIAISVAVSANAVIDSNYVNGVGRWAVDLGVDSIGSLQNAKVSNNIFLNTSQQTDDSAAIYSYAGSIPGYISIASAITGNRIENTGGLKRDGLGNYTTGQSQGIYMDDHVSYAQLTKNVVFNNSSALFLCHGCSSNTADNNISVLQSAPVYDRGTLGQTAATGALAFNGTIYIDLLPSYFSNGLPQSEVVVQAAGASTDATAPHFNVLVDGVVIGSSSASVGASGAPGAATQYPFSANMTPYASHRIGIQLDNGATEGTSTRTLSGLSIVVNNSVLPMASSGVAGITTLNDDNLITNISATHNVVYRANGPGSDISTNTNGYIDPNPGVLDYNLMWQALTKSNSIFFGSPASAHSDVHSLIGDPLFTNLVLGDVTMSTTSPTTGLGITSAGLPLKPPVSPSNAATPGVCSIY